MDKNELVQTRIDLQSYTRDVMNHEDSLGSNFKVKNNNNKNHHNNNNNNNNNMHNNNRNMKYASAFHDMLIVDKFVKDLVHYPTLGFDNDENEEDDDDDDDDEIPSYATGAGNNNNNNNKNNNKKKKKAKGKKGKQQEQEQISENPKMMKRAFSLKIDDVQEFSLVDISTALWDIFIYNACKYSPAQPDIIDQLQFIKLCKEWEIIAPIHDNNDNNNTMTNNMILNGQHILTDVDVQVTFHSEASKSGSHGYGNRNKLTYSCFRRAILALAKKLYPDISVREALLKTLSKHCLKKENNLHTRRLSPNLTNELHDVQGVYKALAPILKTIFGFFASKPTVHEMQVLHRHGRRKDISSLTQSLHFREFLQLCFVFNICKGNAVAGDCLLSNYSISQIFYDSIQVTSVDDCGGLTFEEFWEALVRCAKKYHEDLDDDTEKNFTPLALEKFLMFMIAFGEESVRVAYSVGNDFETKNSAKHSDVFIGATHRNNIQFGVGQRRMDLFLFSRAVKSLKHHLSKISNLTPLYTPNPKAYIVYPTSTEKKATTTTTTTTTTVQGKKGNNSISAAIADRQDEYNSQSSTLKLERKEMSQLDIDSITADMDKKLWGIFTFYTMINSPNDFEALRFKDYLELLKFSKIIHSQKRLSIPEAEIVYESFRCQTTDRKFRFSHFKCSLEDIFRRLKAKTVMDPKSRKMRPVLDKAFNLFVQENIIDVHLNHKESMEVYDEKIKQMTTKEMPVPMLRSTIDISKSMFEVKELLHEYEESLLSIFTFYADFPSEHEREILGRHDPRFIKVAFEDDDNIDLQKNKRKSKSVAELNKYLKMKSKVNIRPINQSLKFSAFYKLCRTFSIITTVTAARMSLNMVQIAKIFLDSIDVICSDHVGGLTFEEFQEALVRAAVLVFANDNASGVSVSEKMLKMFLFMSKNIEERIKKQTERDVNDYKYSLNTKSENIVHSAKLVNGARAMQRLTLQLFKHNLTANKIKSTTSTHIRRQSLLETLEAEGNFIDETSKW